MSDADDQLGGRGGPTGLDPRRAEPGKDNAAPPADRVGTDRSASTGQPSDPDDDEGVDESARQSFPASDPPGDY